MVLNIQFTNMEEGSMISLSYLKNMAFAQGGENGGGSGGGLLWQKQVTDNPCTYTGTTTYWICGGIIFHAYVSGCEEKTETISFDGVVTNCIDGWDFICSIGCEGKL